MTNMEKKQFDFESFKKEAAQRLKKGYSLHGNEGVLTPLLKEFLEESLDGELEAHIDEGTDSNRKNGKGKKYLKTSLGEVELNTPSARNGTFDPELVPKRQRTLGVDLDLRIIYSFICPWSVLRVHQGPFDGHVRHRHFSGHDQPCNH